MMSNFVEHRIEHGLVPCILIIGQNGLVEAEREKMVHNRFSRGVRQFIFLRTTGTLVINYINLFSPLNLTTRKCWKETAAEKAQ